MKLSDHSLLCYLIILLIISIRAQDNLSNQDKIFFGQSPPSEIPEIFMPNIISTGLDELNSVFSPDGQEFYFCVRNFLGAVSIFRMKLEQNTWSVPQLLPFASPFGDIDVTISPDGNTLLFSSKRPIPGEDEPNSDYDLWFVKRTENNWGRPIYLGSKINSEKDEFYPMITNNGTIYFSSQREGKGTSNIYKSVPINGKYQEAIKLCSAINTNYREFDPYISPDEKLLIFTSTRPGGYGSGDLYICFKIKDGQWSEAKNLGNKINSNRPDFCPMITSDGKYLFFTSARKTAKYSNKHFDYKYFQDKHNEPENGTGDIYWVSTRLL